MKNLRKKAGFALSAGLVLAAVFALALTGCPKDPEEDQIDSRLVASWTNNADGSLHAGLVKEFTINRDETFTASINPTFVNAHKTGGDAALMGLEQMPIAEEGTRWTVTGKLVKDEGDVYFMSNLAETSNPPKPADIMNPGEGTANETVGQMREYVTIVFNDNGSFTFSSTTEAVQDFFGGDYVKK
jgi:hypothetical protein